MMASVEGKPPRKADQLLQALSKKCKYLLRHAFHQETTVIILSLLSYDRLPSKYM